MKRLVLAALVAFATSLALADDVPAGYKPASGSPMMVVDENGKARYVKGTDGGAVPVASPVQVNFGFSYDYTCGSSGSGQWDAGTWVDAGTYLLVVRSEEIFTCAATTCASGGRPFRQGTYEVRIPTAGDRSCRSASGTGLKSLTALEQ